jgi:anti-sigma regulatory factor (Ser/Thr protein kinase)
MVSELSTNAILYGMTEFDVSVEVTDDWCRVEVTDSGRGTPVLRALPPSTDERGRGLRIVRELSDDWGVDVSRMSGKCVWFRLWLHPDAAPV